MRFMRGLDSQAIVLVRSCFPDKLSRAVHQHRAFLYFIPLVPYCRPFIRIVWCLGVAAPRLNNTQRVLTHGDGSDQVGGN
jgi:hypothetical protein